MLTLELSSYVSKIPINLIQHLVTKSGWLLDTQSRVLPADWLILEYNEKATLNISMPY